MIQRFVAALVLLIFFTTPGRTEAQGPKSEAAFPAVQAQLKKEWPANRTVRFVFHGHSVPAGYFKTPRIQRFDSYPLLFQKELCDRFPTAPIDVIVTAIGGENSKAGGLRFADDVLSLKPDIVFIDYSLNDRRLGLAEARQYWELMIVEAKQNGVGVVLMTPTPDSREDITSSTSPLAEHTKQVKALGKQYSVPVVDSYQAFRDLVEAGNDVETYLSQSNHPNRKGHEIVTALIMQLFPSKME